MLQFDAESICFAKSRHFPKVQLPKITGLFISFSTNTLFLVIENF